MGRLHWTRVPVIALSSCADPGERTAGPAADGERASAVVPTGHPSLLPEPGGVGVFVGPLSAGNRIIENVFRGNTVRTSGWRGAETGS